MTTPEERTDAEIQDLIEENAPMSTELVRQAAETGSIDVGKLLVIVANLEAQANLRLKRDDQEAALGAARDGLASIIASGVADLYTRLP